MGSVYIGKRPEYNLANYFVELIRGNLLEILRISTVISSLFLLLDKGPFLVGLTNPYLDFSFLRFDDNFTNPLSFIVL